MEIREIIIKQRDALNSVIETTLLDENAIKTYADNFSFVCDFEKLTDLINTRPEHQVFLAAINEFQFALFSSTSGLYRQAYSSLRLFLELSLAAIEYSSNERKLRQWIRGELDIYWTQLINDDDGVLSKPFARLFAEELEEHISAYRAMAARIYRECSEYVHGNSSTHSSLPKDIIFSLQIAEDWNEKANTIKLIVIFAIYMRYFHEQNSNNLNTIESIILEKLGHLEEVRNKFGGVIGG